jgi:tRNA/tmRNA/rRNA uracil-C5-methylase (TrmA/RlmC/RlmD family)
MAENRHRPGIGKELELTIDSMAFGGDGVARHGDFVIFVPDVIPGEQVRVKVDAAKRSYGRAVPSEILKASPDRVEPHCPVYGICGGCQYQHMNYRLSLELKERQIREVMQRIGGLSIDDACDPIIPSPQAYGYRNSITLKIRRTGVNRNSEKGRRCEAGEESRARKGWDAGYIARDNRSFVPVSECPIAATAINKEIANLDSVIRQFKDLHRIRDITIRCDAHRTMLCPRYHKPIRFASEERLCYRHGDLAFYYGGTSFFQVNHAMIPSLLDLVRSALDPGPGRSLIDLYAGVGLFSIALAKHYGHVTGLEIGQEAVECFQENIRANGVSNARVIRGAVERLIRDGLRELGDKPVSVLVDPPREGVKKEVIEALNEGPVERLAYVSCDPATLARDLRLLGAAFTLKRITPLDMFPQTKHLEAVAALERNRP